MRVRERTLGHFASRSAAVPYAGRRPSTCCPLTRPDPAASYPLPATLTRMPCPRPRSGSSASRSRCSTPPRSCASTCGSRRAPEVTGSLTASVGVVLDRSREVRRRASLLPRRISSSRRATRSRRPTRPPGSDRPVLHGVQLPAARLGPRLHGRDALSRRQDHARRAPGRCRRMAPSSIDDPELKLHSAEELDAEFDRGLTHGWSDLNPVRLLSERP